MVMVVLISCASKKLLRAAKAQDLYRSPLFRLQLKYAMSLKANSIFILSAKHGLVDLDTTLAPYDATLNTMKPREVEAWAGRVFEKLEKTADIKCDTFVMLAGERYRKYLVPRLANVQIPLRGLGIGKQLQFLKTHTSYAN